MAKTKIRVVMYTPYTGPTEVKNGNASHVEFKALSDEAGDSVKDRASWMHMKLSQAENLTKGDGDDVQKIFVGPEWSFRKRTGCYSEAERDEILKACEATSKASPGWLYCPGSIIWGKQEKAGKSVEKTRVFNCAPVYAGGKQLLNLYKKTDADVYKVGVKGGCCTKPETDAEIWGMYASVDGDKGTFDNGTVSKYVKTGLFAHNGINFGLEICRDHAEGVLKKSAGGKTVDVQIYPKCSNLVFPANVIVREGGYLLACEGNLEKPNENDGAAASLFKVEKANANALKNPIHKANPNCRKLSGANLPNRLAVFDPLPL